jgi:uridine kinase
MSLRRDVLERLATLLLEVRRDHPLRVAIDGPDAAGKTVLADEFADLLSGERPVIRAGIDGFHNPRELRYRRGPDSPEGYFLDSFDYEALRTLLLDPLGPRGSRRYRRAVFDFRSDSEHTGPAEEAPPDAVLLFDGVFLLRPELRSCWDFSVFVDVDFEETLRRAETRDRDLFGGAEAVRERYQTRYIPGQQLYFARCAPREIADVIVRNTNPSAPEIVAR